MDGITQLSLLSPLVCLCVYAFLKHEKKKVFDGGDDPRALFTNVQGYLPPLARCFHA